MKKRMSLFVGILGFFLVLTIAIAANKYPSVQKHLFGEKDPITITSNGPESLRWNTFFKNK